MGICGCGRNKRKDKRKDKREDKIQKVINLLSEKITESDIEMERLFGEIYDLKEQLEQTNNGGSIEFDRENKEIELEEKIDEYTYLELIKDEYKSNKKKLENAKRDLQVEDILKEVNEAYKIQPRNFEIIDENNQNKREQQKESDIWKQKLEESKGNDNNRNPYGRREKIKNFFISKKKNNK